MGAAEASADGVAMWGAILVGYLPDFIVDLAHSEQLMVDIKGQTGDAKVEAAAAHRWCNALNNDGRFGRWSYHLVKRGRQT